MLLIISFCGCAVEDLERNDGSVEKPYFMNKELLKIVGKRNEKYVEIEGKVQPAADKKKKSKKRQTNNTDTEAV